MQTHPNVQPADIFTPPLTLDLARWLSTAAAAQTRCSATYSCSTSRLSCGFYTPTCPPALCCCLMLTDGTHLARHVKTSRAGDDGEIKPRAGHTASLLSSTLVSSPRASYKLQLVARIVVYGGWDGSVDQHSQETGALGGTWLWDRQRSEWTLKNSDNDQTRRCCQSCVRRTWALSASPGSSATP